LLDRCDQPWRAASEDPAREKDVALALAAGTELASIQFLGKRKGLAASASASPSSFVVAGARNGAPVRSPAASQAIARTLGQRLREFAAGRGISHR
jgi:hypothetical protein